MLRVDLYAVAALAGAAVVVSGAALRLPTTAVTIAGAVLCFALRFMAIRRAGTFRSPANLSGRPRMRARQRIERMRARRGDGILEWMAINSVIGIMERRIFAHLSRILLRGIAHVLGSLGIFFFFGSCRGAHVAVEAILCLGTATIIILACAEQD